MDAAAPTAAARDVRAPHYIRRMHSQITGRVVNYCVGPSPLALTQEREPETARRATSHRVLVTNLPREMTVEELRRVFSRCGEVVDAEVFDEYASMAIQEDEKQAFHKRHMRAVRRQYETRVYGFVSFATQDAQVTALSDPLSIFGVVVQWPPMDKMRELATDLQRRAAAEGKAVRLNKLPQVQTHRCRTHDVEALRTLVIGDLSLETTRSHMMTVLGEVLGDAMQVECRDVAMAPASLDSVHALEGHELLPGYMLVEFDSHHDASKALRVLRELQVNDKKLMVGWHVPHAV